MSRWRQGALKRRSRTPDSTSASKNFRAMPSSAGSGAGVWNASVCSATMRRTCIDRPGAAPQLLLVWAHWQLWRMLLQGASSPHTTRRPASWTRSRSLCRTEHCHMQLSLSSHQPLTSAASSLFRGRTSQRPSGEVYLSLAKASEVKLPSASLLGLMDTCCCSCSCCCCCCSCLVVAAGHGGPCRRCGPRLPKLQGGRAAAVTPAHTGCCCQRARLLRAARPCPPVAAARCSITTCCFCSGCGSVAFWQAERLHAIALSCQSNIHACRAR